MTQLQDPRLCTALCTAPDVPRGALRECHAAPPRASPPGRNHAPTTSSKSQRDTGEGRTVSRPTCSSRYAAHRQVRGLTPSRPLSEELSRKASGRRLSTRSGYKGHLPRSSSAVCPYPLVILLLLDLFHLVKQLAGPELQLGQLVLGSNLRVVVGMLPDLDI